MLKQFGVQHLGGKPTVLPYAYFLFEMPQTTINNLTIENDTIYGDFTFAVQEQPQTILLRIYFSTFDGFTRQSAQYVKRQYLWKHNDRFKNRIYFEDAPFYPGEEIFFKACLYTWVTAIELPYDRRTVYGIDSYYDYENDETIYPNLSDESAQYSFIFPE